MAGPLNGIGGQQQVPLSNPSQASQTNNQVRQQEEDQEPQENTVQPQGSAASETQNTETENEDVIRAQQEDALNNSDNERERGSLVDVTV